MSRDNRWLGRHVVITGATSGIGLATTTELLERGARVTAIGLDDAMSAQLRSCGHEALLVATGDVRSSASLAHCIDQGRATHGPVGALITSAGVTLPSYFAELDEQTHRTHMDVNYFGTLFAIRECLPDLLQTQGSITCMCSAAGLVGVFGYSSYCASKFAVRGLCETLRQELKPKGITVTIICPPDVDTPMLAAEQPLKPAELRALSPGTKPMSAQEVARQLIRGTEQGSDMVVPGAMGKAMRVAAGLAPGLLNRYLDSVIARNKPAV